MDELQLTKKAEAYVAKVEDVNFANSLLTLQIDRTSRRALSLSITALIDMLDDLDPDPDLEDGADAEPWLGWSGNGRGYQEGEGMDDRELDDERQADDGDYDFPGFIAGGGEDGH